MISCSSHLTLLDDKRVKELTFFCANILSIVFSNRLICQKMDTDLQIKNNIPLVRTTRTCSEQSNKTSEWSYFELIGFSDKSCAVAHFDKTHFLKIILDYEIFPNSSKNITDMLQFGAQQCELFNLL